MRGGCGVLESKQRVWSGPSVVVRLLGLVLLVLVAELNGEGDGKLGELAHVGERELGVVDRVLG